MRTEKSGSSQNDERQSRQKDTRQGGQRKPRAAQSSGALEKAEDRAERSGKAALDESGVQEPESLERLEGAKETSGKSQRFPVAEDGLTQEPPELFEEAGASDESEEDLEEPSDESEEELEESLDESEEDLEEPLDESEEDLEELFDEEAFEDPEEDGIEPGEWDGEEEWEEEEEEEEEEEPPKLWKTVAVFLGLIAAAAAVCAVLWHFSHSDGPQGALADSQGQTEGSGSGQMSESGSQGTETPDSPSVSDQAVGEPISGTKDMEFTAVQQTVTPKDVINLRSVPDTSDTGNIVTQIQNGSVLSRTGINEETGWSRLEYNGQTLYGVSQYLTTDLNYKTPENASDPNRISTIDGRVIIFVDCDDWVSPKEYVNLRTEPSTSEGSSTVSCQLNYGEKAHRTGFSPDSGWSRVEYNDQVLYVVTSLVTTEE